MASSSGSVVSVASVETRICLKLSNFQSIFDKIGDRPVAIVSVNGPMRTGKSYILAQFQRFLSTNGQGDWVNHQLDNEFLWKNSANRQTLGINLWSEPFIVVKDGREVAVLLMDTQGCFDDQTSLMESAYNFAVSLILSSVLVYNISKQITEDMLQFLQLFIGYAKVSTEEEGDPERYQRLIFLIRDWQFPDDFGYGYYDDHSSSSERNFKKEKLDPLEGMPDQVRIVHQEIIDSFQSVGCCLMPYPGQGLATRDRTDKLTPEFVDAIRDLAPRIFAPENLVIKRIGGMEVTGTILKGIAIALDQMFAANPIPDIKTMAQENANAQIRIATSVALKLYHEQMKAAKASAVGLQESQFQQLHNQAMARAIEVFKEMRQIRGNANREQALVSLENLLMSKFKNYQKLNELRVKLREAPIAAKNPLEQQYQGIQLGSPSVASSSVLVAKPPDGRSLRNSSMPQPQRLNQPTNISSAQVTIKRVAPLVPQDAPPIRDSYNQRNQQGFNAITGATDATNSNQRSGQELSQRQTMSSLECRKDQNYRPSKPRQANSFSAAPVFQKNNRNPQHSVENPATLRSTPNERRAPPTNRDGTQMQTLTLAPFTIAGQHIDENVLQPILKIAGAFFKAIAPQRNSRV